MMFLKSAFTLLALFSLASAVAIENAAHEQISIVITADPGSAIKAASLTANTACEKDDLDDCKEFCAAHEEKEICVASENKVTCRCKPVKKSEGCQNCLLCLDP